jgi:hypothetical protein
MMLFTGELCRGHSTAARKHFGTGSILAAGINAMAESGAAKCGLWLAHP